MKPIILIGPTAIGKTSTAIELASLTKGEVISADAYQIYKHMDIGTAKPTQSAYKQIPHHLVDQINPNQPYTVFDFAKKVQELVPIIQKNDNMPFIVGGNGLFINALVSGLSFTNSDPNPDIRSRLSSNDSLELHKQLSAIDPQAATIIHPNNKKRIIRALEVYETTGIPFSQQITKENHEKDYLIIGLTIERPELYKKIDQRVELMFQQGLVAEVQGLLDQGYDKNLQALQALGYKETIAYLENNDPDSVETLQALIQQRTRNFAKRQLTWFRRFTTTHWFHPSETEKMLELIKQQEVNSK